MFGDLADPGHIDEGGECERCYVPQRLHNLTEAMRAAVFSDRDLIVYLNGRGWLGEMSVSSGKRNQPAMGQILVETRVAASQTGDSQEGP